MAACLYENLAPYTCLGFFAAIIRLEAGVYFKGVWLIIIISEAGMDYFSTILTISSLNINTVSLGAPSGISGRVALQPLFTKLILTEKRFAQVE